MYEYGMQHRSQATRPQLLSHSTDRPWVEEEILGVYAECTPILKLDAPRLFNWLLGPPKGWSVSENISLKENYLSGREEITGD